MPKKLYLTENETQAVINSQRCQIAELKGRLARAWTETCYLNSAYVVELTETQINNAIKHMQNLIECDQPDGPEDWGFHHQYDHEAIEERIKEFEELKNDKDFHMFDRKEGRVKVPIYSYAFWYVITNYDDQKARDQVSHFESLRKRLVKEGEPQPPDHFFSGPKATWM